MEVALEVYRAIVARAERGLITARVVLPRALYVRVSTGEREWLESLGVVIESGDLTEPVFVDK